MNSATPKLSIGKRLNNHKMCLPDNRTYLDLDFVAEKEIADYMPTQGKCQSDICQTVYLGRVAGKKMSPT